MEKWQQLGYESFSAWRHAYDRERRKKLAATKLAAASTPTVRWQPSFAPHIEQNDLNTDVTVSNDIQNALLDQLMLSPIRLYIEQQGATEKQ